MDVFPLLYDGDREKGQGVLTARQLGLRAAEAHRHTFSGRAVEFSS